MYLQRGVDAGEQPLGGGLFVARRSVDLPREEEPGDDAGFERAAQPTGIEVVVFDGIAWAQDVGILHAFHRADEFELYVERQAGGDAVGVELVGREAFGFEVDLVRRLVGEAVNLVFDGRTIARTDAFDDAGVHGRPVESAADDIVGAFVGVSDPARHLARMLFGAAEKREHGNGIEVTGLFFENGEVDGTAVDARRRTGFQPTLR